MTPQAIQLFVHLSQPQNLFPIAGLCKRILNSMRALIPFITYVQSRPIHFISHKQVNCVIEFCIRKRAKRRRPIMCELLTQIPISVEVGMSILTTLQRSCQKEGGV